MHYKFLILVNTEIGSALNIFWTSRTDSKLEFIEWIENVCSAWIKNQNPISWGNFYHGCILSPGPESTFEKCEGIDSRLKLLTLRSHSSTVALVFPACGVCKFILFCCYSSFILSLGRCKMIGLHIHVIVHLKSIILLSISITWVVYIDHIPYDYFK